MLIEDGDEDSDEVSKDDDKEHRACHHFDILIQTHFGSRSSLCYDELMLNVLRCQLTY